MSASELHIQASPKMPIYRRYRHKGATVFLTINLEDRASFLLIDRIDDLRSAYRYACSRHPVRTEAICVLPNHMHVIWTLPEGDDDYSMRVYLMKSAFSRCIPRREHRSRSRRKRGERGVWQRRFWEHTIRDDADFENHLAYTFGNAAKHGLVEAAEDWPYASLHNDYTDWCNSLRSLHPTAFEFDVTGRAP